MMKNTNLLKRLLSLLLIALVGIIISCDGFNLYGDDDDDPINEPVNPFTTMDINGVLTLPPGCNLDPSTLEVISITDKSPVASDGSFEITILDSEKYQVLLFNNADNQTVFMGLFDPDDNSVMADEISTALALVLFTDYLFQSNHNDRKQYLQTVEENALFPSLLESLRGLYSSDAYNALEYDINPSTYQILVQIIQETFVAMGSDIGKVDIGDPPIIEDGSGGNIKFVNNRHITYAAGIYKEGTNTITNTVTVDRKKTMFSFQFGWPPTYLSDPEETLFDLGDGSYKIELLNGMEYGQIFNWDDPEGRATLFNTGNSIWYMLEIVVSLPGQPDIAKLPNYLTLTPDHVVGLANSVKNRSARDFLLTSMGVIEHNSEELAYWIFQDFQTNAAHQFISSASVIFKNVSLVFKLLAFVNEQGPFFFDLIFAPEVTYFITQSDGVITSTSQNDPPNAMFTIDPPAGIIGTNIMFDASSTTDDVTQFSDLNFRWDLMGNDTWTSWSNSPTIEYTYSDAGSYNVVLEVMDADGQIGYTSHTINIGGGSGSANHIKLFMDVYPWDNNAMLEMLGSLGFSEGSGADQYEIIPSSEMASTSLYPGEDLVIISNDQPQQFYDNYAISQVKFSDFVYNGGSLFWEACDGGWNEGYINQTSIRMPGNISLNLNYDYYNYVANPHLPLVTGLPESMDHNYASHEYFGNTPDGTIVYCIDSGGNPTLIEFNLGSGWIIVSGQPLEHQYRYIYGNNDMEMLLPRIVAYFTGKEFITKHTSPALQNSILPSHK